MPSSTNSKLWIAGIGRTKHYIQNFLKTTSRKANISWNYSSVKTAKSLEWETLKNSLLRQGSKKCNSPRTEGNWSRNASWNFFRDRYWGRAGQPLANSFPVSSNSPRNLCESQLGPRDLFLEKPGNFSGPKVNFKIKTFVIVAQFLAHKPVNFASLTDSFIVSLSELLKLESWIHTRQT